MDQRQIRMGIHRDYHWLTSTEDYSGTLLRLCPEVVVGRYVAVTELDGGALRLSPQQIASGWTTREGVAYSPKISEASEIPHQRDGLDDIGYDEFYVFTSPCDLGARTEGNLFEGEFAPAPGRVVPFVRWASFVLHDPGDAQAIVSLFWPQLLRLMPESFVADGWECLTFVSQRQDLVELLRDRLEDQT